MTSTTEVEEETTATIHIPRQWSEAADRIATPTTASHSRPPVAFVCGAKNSGKTTFCRYFLNLLLHRYRKVAYLDTDVGQPEFTAPGFLSVTMVDQQMSDLAIPRLKTPERCFFFGDVSSKRDPTAYLTYIYTLYDYYKKEYRVSDDSETPQKFELPLIVNTPGWVKGVGYDLLVDMLKYIALTHVVKINVPYQKKNLPVGAFWLDDDYGSHVNLIEINPAHRGSFSNSVTTQKDARLLRDFRLMAYFKQCFPSNMIIITIKELAKALVSHPPYQVPISRIKIRHLHCEVPTTEIFYSLNATIVGLAVSSGHSDDLPWSIGLGIVRGIDTSKGLLYVITPVPPSILEKVDLLLQGWIQIPTSILQIQGCRSPYISANVLPSN